jgi:hypothetical protein
VLKNEKGKGYAENYQQIVVLQGNGDLEGR